MEIIVFSGQKNFTREIQQIILENKAYQNCTVVEAVGQKINELAEEFYHQGSRVFIARGQNYDRLKHKYAVPTIEVHCSYEEILQAYECAKTYGKPIGIIGYGSIYKKIITVKENSKLDFTPLCFHNTNEIKMILKKAKDNGIEVIVGGLSSKQVCDELGLIHVTHNINPKCLKDALDEAETLLSINQEKNKQFNFVQTIVNMSAESVIAFDSHLKIQFLNQSASKLLRIQTKEHLKLAIWTETNFKRIFFEGEEIKDRLIELNGYQYSLSITPLTIDKTIYGAAVYLKSIVDRLSSDSLLRKKLNEKGHVATKSFCDIIGDSLSLRKTIDWAKKVAKSNNSVLISGETGTGKELFAQSIHNYSNRSSGPFIAINCAALSSSVLESELFGYVKGAFTGASQEGKIGIFELAHTGTVFLDEIGEISLEVQAKLLRVLQEKEIVRVGDTSVIPVDVRIISATNRPLKVLSEKNHFRKDLYYRLATLDIKLPSLRERAEDIPALIENYLEQYYPEIQVHPVTLDYFKKFPYEGNIRQLINLIERSVVMSEGSMIEHRTVIDICQAEFNFQNDCSDEQVNNATNRESIEKEHLQNVLQKNMWNKKKTAEDLGISTTTLWRKIKKMGLS